MTWFVFSRSGSHEQSPKKPLDPHLNSEECSRVLALLNTPLFSVCLLPLHIFDSFSRTTSLNFTKPGTKHSHGYPVGVFSSCKSVVPSLKKFDGQPGSYRPPVIKELQVQRTKYCARFGLINLVFIYKTAARFLDSGSQRMKPFLNGR